MEALLKGLEGKQSVNTKNKDALGEVFTPLEMVEELFDKLPSTMWTNPELKWFEPAVGRGVFVLALIRRLIKYHSIDHILSKMVYMSELSQENCAYLRTIFAEYTIHLYEGNTLNLDTKKEWGIEAFDVVMGNPPFQKGGVATAPLISEGKREKGVYGILWGKFIEMAMRHLKPNGFLVYITPPRWVVPTSKSHSILNHQVVYVRFIYYEVVNKLMGANVNLSLYVVQKKPPSVPTEIVGICGKTAYQLLAFGDVIPQGEHDLLLRIRTFIKRNNCQATLLRPTAIRPTGELLPLPSAYTADDNLVLVKYTNKAGFQVRRSIRSGEQKTQRKLICACRYAYDIGLFSDDGRLITDGCHGIDYFLTENHDLMKKVLGFNLMKTVVKYTKTSMRFKESYMAYWFADLSKIGIQDITEEEFNRLIKAYETEEEVRPL